MPDSYFGKYSGVVKDNRDPDKLGVVKVSVPTVFPPEELVPARAALPYGVFFIPENDTQVWVEFEGGDPAHPLWTGIQHVPGTPPAEGAKEPPTVRLIKTPAGHLLIFDDTDGSEAVTLTDGKNGHSLAFTGTGVEVTDGVNRHVITLDGDGVKITDGANRHEITLAAASIEIKHGAGLAKATITSNSVKAEAGAGSVEIGAGEVKVNAPMVTVSGGLVKLGAGGAPVLHAGDMGVGNLGAPVVPVPTQFQVLA